MNISYYILIAFFVFALYKRVNGVISSIKERNNSWLKVEIFFLMILIIVGIALLLLLKSFH